MHTADHRPDPVAPATAGAPVFFTHPTAVVDAGAKIGDGTRVWHFCHIMAGSCIGRNVSLGQNVFVAAGAVIGDGCRLQNNISVFAGVVLEPEVFCGPSMVFTNVHIPRAFESRKAEFRQTLVSRGASLGANCTIVCGNDIGEYAMVAAGAVVTREVLPHQLVAGVPARPLGWVCRCGERLGFESSSGRCIRCGDEYTLLSEGGVRRVSAGE